MSANFEAVIDYEDPYVDPLLLSALKSRLPESSYRLSSAASEGADQDSRVLQIRQYEKIDFEAALQSPSTNLINCYVIRKALIRKHYLSTTISSWIVKHPDSKLRRHFQPAVDFELDYAEFLDDALIEAFELHESFQSNDGAEPKDRQWWILKPGMSDRGQGIRLFSTQEELADIFQVWEDGLPESEEEEEEEEEDEGHGEKQNSTGIITSQLRHFIAQQYIHPPLLLADENFKKFHIRTYVLAVGALRVYVYKDMLALFAPERYEPPWEQSDLRAHLTNTCLQDSGEREGNVRAFWILPDGEDGHWQGSVFKQICDVTGEVFEAAARGMMVHFQPLPNTFEVYGLDFLVDTSRQAWLLEVNAFPDFRQTGDELKGVVQGLFEEVVDVAVKPFFGIDDAAVNGTARMHKVLDIDLGRR